jgi:predicted double-glycine peptidase
VTVANCLGDAIGNNIDYRTFAPDNNKQLIRKTYEEVKDRLKSETHGVFYSNVSTPKRKREIYVNDISLQ